MHDEDDGLSEYLRRLRILTRPWPGEPVGKDGLLRRLNPAGSKPPLFWCFNAEHEFGMMAAGLGPEQPLVGMRSLNRIASPGPEVSAAGRRLADLYARTLMGSMEFDRCAVGGNCQSAAIATRIAVQLLRAGKQVDLLLNLEAVPPMPYPGRVALLFGRESATHNPFLKTERPQDRWRAIYGEVGWTIVPGGHGQYFTEANLGALCAAIGSSLAAAIGAPALGPAPRARLTLSAPPGRVAAGARVVLVAEIKEDPGRAEARPYLVQGLWSSETLGSWAPPAEDAPLLQRVPAGHPVDLAFPAPPMPGRWRLNLFLCQEEAGPVDWERDLASPLTIDLIGEAVPA